MTPNPEPNDLFVSRAQSYFEKGDACSRSVLMAYAPCYPLDRTTVQLISSSLGGRAGRLRWPCRAVTGAFMELVLAYGNEIPKDRKTKLNGYSKVGELDHKAEANHGKVNGKELLKKYAAVKEALLRNQPKVFCRPIVGGGSALL